MSELFVIHGDERAGYGISTTPNHRPGIRGCSAQWRSSPCPRATVSDGTNTAKVTQVTKSMNQHRLWWPTIEVAPRLMKERLVEFLLTEHK